MASPTSRQDRCEVLRSRVVALELVCKLVGVRDEVFQRASHLARLLVTRNLANVADLLKPAGQDRPADYQLAIHMILLSTNDGPDCLS
ncbi:hypothetical protein JNB_08929 [Janibacter sp. HTCC2649]|nr:hypothetical protein JNB_08929 [Janibacter sp. HTCC2649]